MPGPKTKTYIRRTVKLVAWLVAGIFCLLLFAVVALQFPRVQRLIALKAASFISEKTHTRIGIGSVDIAFTHSVVLHDIFVESRQRDTLLFVQRLAVDVNLLGLFSQELHLKNIFVDSLTAHITRTLPDSSYNFDFILAALGGDSVVSDEAPDSSAGAGLGIRFGGLSLNGVYGTYNDEVSGLNGSVHVGSMRASLDEFDLERNRYHIAELSLENTAARVVQTKETPAEESESAGPEIGLGSVTLANVQCTYDNMVTGEHAAIDLGTSNLVTDAVDLPSHRMALKLLSMENTAIIVRAAKLSEPSSRQPPVVEPEGAGIPWVISLDRLDLKNNSIQYDEATIRTRGLDPHHIMLSGLTMQAGELYYGGDRIAANIGHASFREQSGLDVREMSGAVVFDSVHAELSDFTLETAASRISQDVLLTYPHRSVLTDSPGDVHVKATIARSKISISDLLFFQPSLPLKNHPGASVSLSAKLSGAVRDLRIDELMLAAGDSTRVDLVGTVRGLPEFATAFYDLDVRRFSSGRGDIHALAADTLLPENIIVPASVNITGTFKGTTSRFTTSSDVVTSIGNVRGSATLNSDSLSTSRWRTDVSVSDFNIGALLNDTTVFGPVSLEASATGTGLGKDDVEGQFDLNVEKAVFNGYQYRNFSASGTAGSKMFEGKAEMKDSNIAFTFDGTVNTTGETPTYKFTLDLQGADLQRLRLTSDDVRVAGVITSDLTGQGLNDMNGRMDVRNVVIIKNRRRYVIDSLLYLSVNKEKETHISFESAVFAAKFDGTIALGDLPGTLKSHFSRYFTLHDTTVAKAARAQKFAFQVALRDPKMITDVFLPRLDRLSVGTVEGSYDSEKQNLNLNVVVSTVDYSGFRIDSVVLRVTSDVNRLEVTLGAGSIADSMLHITNLQLAASVENDSVDVALQIVGDTAHTKMLLAGVFNSIPEGYRFRFKPGGVIFQNIAWTVPADNELLVGPHRFIAHNIVLARSNVPGGPGQSLSINSTGGTTSQPPLEITLSHFDLGTFSRVVERDSGLVRGVLDGNVVLRNLDKQMAFTSDLTVKDFSFRQRLVGDISLHANNQTENVYYVTMNLTGNNNDIAVQGKYLSKEGGSELDLTLGFKKVNLASLEPFMFGTVRRLSGTMSGALHLTGTRKKPSITGNLRFAGAAGNPAMLDSYLRLDDGEIIFDGKGVHFGSFELVDTLGNKASVRGNLFTENFRDFSYDFRVHTENFLLMNKPASRDALYYGTIFLDSDISIQGNHAKPVIHMQAKLDEGTDLKVVLPESETAVEQRRGIVRFVDVKNPSNTILSRRKSGGQGPRDTTRAELSAIDLTSNIEINKKSRIRILIDPIAGDSLVIRGEATFSVGVDPSGKLAVTGRYEILEGSYRLSFGEFIRREFIIEKGSSLTWFGSVTDANADITAIYTVKTSALDLVQDQLVGLSQEEKNKYKQELRIQVYLMMKGKLLEPDIHFKLDLPPDQRGVLGGSIYAKLNELNGQESELNKQVFALLVLGRFISSNPLASSGETGLTGFARSSASQILTEQLNRLSEKFISGVSLELGVDSYQDYSTGSAEGRTQLQVALTKQLFDERVSVQVGGNVDLEGQRSQQNSLNNFAGDIKVGYKLTEDGRWQLQVFRQNTYEGAIEGDLVETGVGVVFTIDYDKLFGFTLRPVPPGEEEK